MENVTKPLQSYLDYFIKSCRPEEVPDKIVTAIKGTCNSMCPDEEVILRKRENLVHALEIVGNKQKLVKRYSRPAADMNLAVAHNLRPFHVLKETVSYLLFEVTKRTDASRLVIYNFVADRLRAVRQDIIIQDLLPDLQITLLEPMIRFHIYYGYLLCETPVNDYSPTLNRNFLLECLKTCLYCYDEIELKNTAETKTHNISFIIKNMGKCNLQENKQMPGSNRDLVEALYVLTTLYDESPMWRLGRLSEHIRHAPTVRQAYRLAAAALHNYYVTVSKSLSHLCPLMFCAVVLFLPILQRRALQVMSVAYSCRGRHVPLRAVREWLGVADDAAIRAILRHYGLTETGGQVACQRGSFREDAPLLPPSKITSKHLEGKMNIDYILTYTPRDS